MSRFRTLLATRDRLYVGAAAGRRAEQSQAFDMVVHSAGRNAAVCHTFRLRRPVRLRSDPRCRIVLAHMKHLPGRFNLGA